MRPKNWRSTLVISMTFLALIRCDYDVPITPEPTRRIETSLLGTWNSIEKTNSDRRERMKVQKYDDTNYIVIYEGDLFRVWHSDIGDAPFITVQSLDSAERKYFYFAWSSSDEQLTLRPVKSGLIPKETRDSATVAKILRANAGNSRMFDDAALFSRKE